MTRQIAEAPAADSQAKVASQRNDAGTDSAVSNQLTALAKLDVDSLRQRWRRLFRKAAPPGLTRHLLVRILAYRIQVNAYGDLTRETRKMLEAIGRSSERPGEKAAVPPPPALRALLPGTLLSREYEGVMHRVTVLEEGFAWEGHTYPNLSQIARAITGTNWNGPRFFGLRDAPTQRKSPSGSPDSDDDPDPQSPVSTRRKNRP